MRGRVYDVSLSVLRAETMGGGVCREGCDVLSSTWDWLLVSLASLLPLSSD